METQANPDYFPTDTGGLPEARPPESFELADGDEVGLRIAPVVKKIGDAIVRMLAYDGSIPGPVLRVRQGSKLVVDVVNDGDLETTVHWHGLRLDNRFDGTTETQRPIPVGGSFTYHLEFPDPGVYWYHPHIRQDYGQEVGLYGNIVVVPAEPDYWPAVHRELTLTLDDILLEDGKVAPFDRRGSTYTAMGRFGDVLLVNGEPAPSSLTVRSGEVVRLYLTNTANARVFNVVLRGASMKLVGGDSGHYEREQIVDGVVLAPSERAVVDVLFATPGELILEHRTPQRGYPLAAIRVVDEPVVPALAAEFATLRTNPDMQLARELAARYLDAAPDRTLALVAEMDLGTPELPPGATVEYYCPMHPAVRSDRPERCPECGMKLVAAQLVGHAAGEASDRAPHPGHDGGQPHEHGAGDHAHEAGGIEWEDDMVDVNRMTNPSNTRWRLIDRATGAHGAAIDWRFHVGDRVKIRVVNEMDSDHPMHHPLHIHGAGRFLILSRDGVVEPNLVWKDTVLVPTGQRVDILLDVTHPGRWMTHCHIAEHHEGGMMFSFDVEP
jgi:FtsP/CotA-like multicopper oxidase with cupredoxin domain